MAPGRERDDSDGGDDSQGEENLSTLAAQERLRARLSRKRTKTGCLTCRKRRIKCGEERPVCRNCIKSKRHCEGYNQRVVFKQPFYDFQAAPNGAAHITFQAGLLPGPATPFYAGFPPPGNGNLTMAQLQPRPVEQFVPHGDQTHSFPVPAQPQMYHQGPYSNGGANHGAAAPLPIQLLQPHPLVPLPVAMQAASMPAAHHYPAPQYTGYNSEPVHAEFPPNGFNPNAQSHQFVSAPLIPAQPPPMDQLQPPQLKQIYTPPLSATQSERTPPSRAATGPSFRQSMQGPRSGQQQYPVRAATLNGDQRNYPPPQGYALGHPVTPEYYEHETHLPLSESPTQLLSQAAVEVHDEDYYDVQSDEEMDIDTNAMVAIGRTSNGRLSRILDGNHITIHDSHTRRYDTFLYDGMVEKYRVEEHANPLNNPATARVFAHFISVTGPSLSIFERHPRNTSVLFTTGQIPVTQQGLWTYTMPLAALRNQGLLHAMLALASLHIARLTGASVTPSMQHYAWALKRIHSCVGDQKKRLRLTTVAASMLLGFYEIMTADHMKWNTHLAGSKQLFVETDFVYMMQQFRHMKLDARAREQMGQRRQSTSPISPSPDELLDQIPDVDERVISTFAGREVRYGDHGQIMTPISSIPQELDLSKFEILKDLYWWYCKQDAYQSIISGNPLLMDFSRWADCPPRAQLGRPDAIYGTFDHLVLLIGRIADFAARDRARKLKQMELNGGQWRPPPGMQMPAPPQVPPASSVPANGGGTTNGHHMPYAPTQATPAPVPAPPMFYGMAPAPNPNVQMPSAYHPAFTTPMSKKATPHDPIVDIHMATQAALHEYGCIRAALHEFQASLGEAFQPLSPEFQLPYETPFGLSVCYRSFDIACLWAIYNMTMIIAIRSHPHMPPAAHMAAGVAAKDTNHHAEEIGRIVAGIVPGPADQPLNPSLGAALCESCMPSFFASVQYLDHQQRVVTVDRIYTIAHRTGWGTAELIASGCETAWVKAAEAGRGPPYQRLFARKQQSDDPRLNGSWERLDPNASPDDKDDTDRRHVRRKAQARLNWAIGILGTPEDKPLI
ncbi:hypothetical protein LTR86_008390 [Recurvomyces mirabilis]|nr:hypothetical protein LTR86_008390 [Recurvomyces mirabilis]